MFTALQNVRRATHSKGPLQRAWIQLTVAHPPLGLSSFYDQVPVLNADGPARRSRLDLCRLSVDTLKLGLLGIPSLERIGGGIRGISDDGFLAIRLESCLTLAINCPQRPGIIESQ